MNRSTAESGRTSRLFACFGYDALLMLLIALVLLLILSISFEKQFDHDEFEHIHSAWYISHGAVPYSDFFQHHNPLLWIVMIPFLVLFGETVQTPVIIRFFMLAQLMGIAYMTYKLATAFGRSRESGLWAVLLLLTMVMFVEKAVEIRPDVPQVLFGLISLYYLLAHFENSDRKTLLLSAFAGSISFLFLQKHLFLLLVMAMALIYKFIRRRISLSEILIFAGGFLSLQLLLLIYLVVTGSLGDYYLTTVKLNLSQPQPFAGHANLTRSFYQNTMFWILGGGGALILLIRPRLPFNLKVVSFAGIVLVLTAFIAKQPHRQYFMGALPLLSISGGYVLTELTDRMRSPKILRAVILMCLIAMPLIYLTFVKQRTNGKQLAAIQYVLENSASNDCVYDGDIQFNLYRRDLHYFWYSVSKNKGLDNFNKITNGRYQDYNICALILSKKPKIISRFNLNINECDLMSYYTQTEFKNIYIRRDGNAAF